MKMGLDLGKYLNITKSKFLIYYHRDSTFKIVEYPSFLDVWNVGFCVGLVLAKGGDIFGRKHA